MNQRISMDCSEQLAACWCPSKREEKSRHVVRLHLKIIMADTCHLFCFFVWRYTFKIFFELKYLQKYNGKKQYRYSGVLHTLHTRW